MLTSYISFVKAHEKILGMTLVAAVIFGGWSHIETIIQRHDASHEVQAQIVATAQAEKNAAIAAQVAVDNAAFSALQAKVTAQNAALIQANVALATALAKQQKTDAGLPLPELANRWLALVPDAKPTVTVDGGVFLPESGAVATVQQLEEVPVQAQELVNDQILITNGNDLAGVQTKQVADLNAQVSGLNLQIVDNGKVCDARVKVIKDAAAKSKRRWFLIGLVSGFIGRSIIK